MDPTAPAAHFNVLNTLRLMSEYDRVIELYKELHHLETIPTSTLLPLVALSLIDSTQREGFAESLDLGPLNFSHLFEVLEHPIESLNVLGIAMQHCVRTIFFILPKP